MVNQTLSIYNDIVYFGVDKFYCDEIHLLPGGLKFHQVCQVQEKPRFNITIPPIDIKKAYFDSKTGGNLSTLIAETVPESGMLICLKLKLNQAANSGGSIRILVQFTGKGEEIKGILDEYFSFFSQVNWKLERVLSRGVHKYLDFLENYSQQSSIRAIDVSSSNSDNFVFNMEVNQTLSVHNNSILFGIHKFTCEELRLISKGIKFVRVSAPGIPNLAITISPIDIQKFYFDSKTGENLSTLIIETVPSSSFKLCESLQIQRNQGDHMEGTIRVAVQLNGKNEEIQNLLEEYFATFNTVTWKLDRNLSVSAHQYFDLLNNSSQQPTVKSSTSSSAHKSPCTLFSPQLVKSKKKTSNLKTDETTSIVEINSEDKIENANTAVSNSDDRLFSYPPIPIYEVEHISIRQSDLACLEEGQQINDAILGFYLKYIEKDLTSPDIAERCYIFSSSFYYNLTHKPQTLEVTTPGRKSLSDKYYNRVKNWTKNVNIFEKDFLIIPIHKFSHWFLAIICFPRKVPLMDEVAFNEKNAKRPRILFMDSTQSAHSRCGLAAPLRHFLAKEWESKKTTKKSFSKSVMPDIYLKVPKQNNDFDSGLYVLQYIENFLRNPDHLLDKVSKDTAINLEDWFSHRLVSAKRRTIKRLIKQQRKAEEIKKNSLCETDEEISSSSSSSSSSSYSFADSEISTY
ncbi:sentrin-specific protease 6-like [Panonychus citri]|uniref:sentrin-specific protease 6-like n=1 Tax=Panonychus citri TaxID=50023 RepID=UPI0023083018|nr:sentrin-specific protease 6-like [Panonychus citri]